MSLPIKLFFMIGVTVDVLWVLYPVILQKGLVFFDDFFSKSELDELRLGFGVRGLEHSSEESLVLLSIVFERRLFFKTFRKLFRDGERRCKPRNGVPGVFICEKNNMDAFIK